MLSDTTKPDNGLFNINSIEFQIPLHSNNLETLQLHKIKLHKQSPQTRETSPQPIPFPQSSSSAFKPVLHQSEQTQLHQIAVTQSIQYISVLEQSTLTNVNSINRSLRYYSK